MESNSEVAKSQKRTITANNILESLSPKKKKRYSPLENEPKFKDSSFKKEKKRPNPDSYIRKRIAKNFDGNIYFGTITEYKKEDSMDEGFWHVLYDDNDEEEFDANDLSMALDLYASSKGEDDRC